MIRKGQKSLSINRLQINNPLQIMIDMVKSFLLQLALLQDHQRFMIQVKKRWLIWMNYYVMDGNEQLIAQEQIKKYLAA